MYLHVIETYWPAILLKYYYLKCTDFLVSHNRLIWNLSSKKLNIPFTTENTWENTEGGAKAPNNSLATNVAIKYKRYRQFLLHQLRGFWPEKSMKIPAFA